MTDAVDFQMQLAKPAQFGDPSRSTTPVVVRTRVSANTRFREYSLLVHRARRLPLHRVGLVALPQAEGAGEVAGEELDLLDVGDEGLVDGLLVRGAGAGDLLLL